MSLSDHIIDTCDHGHKFAKLDDHPGNSCVHCLRLGLASARAEVEQLREDKAAERERDALAAHVERLRKAALDAIFYLPGGEIKAELRDAYDETPEASLAKLKAQWQAEALEELLQNTTQFREANPVRGLAGSMADELRQQAVGGEE